MNHPKHLGIYRAYWVLIAIWDALLIMGALRNGEAGSIVPQVAGSTGALLVLYGFVALFIGWVQEERMVGWLRGTWPKPVPQELAAQLDALRGDAWRPKNAPLTQRVAASTRVATDTWD